MKTRINSIDIVRGLIMIIMTLDHTRDFLHFGAPSPTNMQTTTVVLFFTRWITHFCAPTFVFLAGVSAVLAGQRRSRGKLRDFLLKRGAWLIVSDLLLISFIFTLDPAYHVLVLEVLWATGFGMILLALLARAPIGLIAITALLILFGHNLLDYLTLPKEGSISVLLKVFLTAAGSFFPLSGTRSVIELYAVLPWSGALLLGYVFGQLYRDGYPASKRQRILLASGVLCCLLFVALRFINYYGNPAPWSVQRDAAHTLLSFLNTAKQPPSLLFFLMTLGPIMVFLSFAENLKGRFADICRVYGNVPYFYFIIHLSLLRVLNLLLIPLSGLPYQSDGNPIVWQAVNFGFPLWAVYLFWLFIVAVLYYPCKWFGNYKRNHQQWWVSYL